MPLQGKQEEEKNEFTIETIMLNTTLIPKKVIINKEKEKIVYFQS